MSTTISPLAAAHALRSVSLPDVATVEHLARMLDLAPSTVRTHLRAGDLPGRKIGRRWYVAREALLRELASRGGRA